MTERYACRNCAKESTLRSLKAVARGEERAYYYCKSCADTNFPSNSAPPAPAVVENRTSKGAKSNVKKQSQIGKGARNG